MTYEENTAPITVQLTGEAEPTWRLRWALDGRLQQEWKVITKADGKIREISWEWRYVPFEGQEQL